VREDRRHAVAVPRADQTVVTARAPACAVMDSAGDSLVMEVLERFGEVRVRVAGTSMVPTVWPGDMVTIRRCAMTDIDVGDIVAVTRRGRLFVHRAVTRHGHHLLTRGDALGTDDPPVSPDQFLGRLESIDRGGRRSDPPALTMSRRILAAVVRRSTRATRLLLTGQRLKRRLVWARWLS
jgi:signal peptidase